jgi:type III pantothenate kinase
MPSRRGTESAAVLLAVAIGNTRTRLALLQGLVPSGAISVANDDLDAIARAAADLAELAPSDRQHDLTAVVASVNPPVSSKVEPALLDRAAVARVLRLGRDLPITIHTSLDDDSTVGQDRLLACLGAHALLDGACVVVDAGTCVTVDFIDGAATFHGGAIAPGLSMMLNAMHAGTAALPRLDVAPPDPARGPFGKDTPHAMTLGAFSAVRGLVRLQAERYAEVYQAYPSIIATGGDAAALFEGDELVERIEPDLQLIGIARAAHLALTNDDDHAPRLSTRDDEDPFDDQDDEARP